MKLNYLYTFTSNYRGMYCRIFFTLFFTIYLSSEAFAQRLKATIELNDSTSLILVRDTFIAAGKTIEYYEGKFPYAIDGVPIFGADGSIPNYILKNATLKIGTRELDLQVDGMYEPWYGDQPNRRFFKIKQDGTELKILGFFSDAAGHYGAEWMIIGNSSVRTILTRDERILFECLNEDN